MKRSYLYNRRMDFPPAILLNEIHKAGGFYQKPQKPTSLDPPLDTGMG